MPNNPTEFTDEQKLLAEGMVLNGVPFEEIGRLLDCSVNTLKKHLGDTLRDAKGKMISRVARNLFQTSLRGGKEGVTASIFILKTQAGWKETTAVELTGGHGGPVQIDLGKLSDEQLTGLESLIAAVGTRAALDSGGEGTTGTE